MRYIEDTAVARQFAPWLNYLISSVISLTEATEADWGSSDPAPDEEDQYEARRMFGAWFRPTTDDEHPFAFRLATVEEAKEHLQAHPPWLELEENR